MALTSRARRGLQRHGLRSVLALASCVLTLCAFIFIQEVVALGLNGANPHVLFCSVALEKHLVPLLRMAEELQARGFDVSFASHDEAYAEVRSALPGARFVSAGPLPGGGGPGRGGGRGDDDPRRWMNVDEELSALSRFDFRNAGSFFGHHYGLGKLMRVLYMPSIEPFYNALMHFAAECNGGEAHCKWLSWLLLLLLLLLSRQRGSVEWNLTSPPRTSRLHHPTPCHTTPHHPKTQHKTTQPSADGVAATSAGALRETGTASAGAGTTSSIAEGLCTRRPDVVVMDAWTFGARDAADVMGVPVVVNSANMGYRIGANKAAWHPGPYSGLPADMTFADRM